MIPLRVDAARKVNAREPVAQRSNSLDKGVPRTLGGARGDVYPFRMRRQFLVFLGLFASVTVASAETQPRVGRAAAAKYFEKRAPDEASTEERLSSETSSVSDHYLAIHLGRFVSGSAWEWGRPDREDNAGTWSYGLTYRLYEWGHASDVLLRVDFNEYDVANERPLKMSILPMIILPDASARFPLYFGVGAGLGVFFRQVKDESSLSFDYQLVAGARFFNVSGNTGFFIETGMKNHLLLTSTGQYNGVFLSGGALFTF